MRKKTAIILTAAVMIAVGTAGVYTAIGMHYKTHFVEHTTINGMDVSDLTADEAEKLIADQAEDYRVTVTTKEGTSETIEGSTIGYRFVSGGEVQEFLESQNWLMWLPGCLGDGRTYTVDAAVTYDESLLAGAVEGLSCMQEENITKPADARVEKGADGTYAVIPETEGNEPDEEKVTALLRDTVSSGGRSADLVSADCYKKPAVRSDDASLQEEAATLNRYSTMHITYQMGGDVTEELDSETIAGWFSLDENKNPVFDREQVAAWVNQLADQYDTIGASLPFVTTNGETVWVESVTYGWQMDRESETEALYQQLLSGESGERSPVWYEAAWTRGENDIGNTYVEIDYTNQRMWYYKDGMLLVDTPVVTGNVSAGNASPEGVFCLVGKEEDATLVGEDYKTPVDYWMPFYGGVGIHDADSWRSSYGGDIYQWSGSHGCINTPTAQAAVIYENIEIGTPIICYSSGMNYGYSQSTGGSGGNVVEIENNGQTDTGASEGDVVVVEGDSSFGSTGGGEADFPITITDEGTYGEEQVIY